MDELVVLELLIGGEEKLLECRSIDKWAMGWAD